MTIVSGFLKNKNYILDNIMGDNFVDVEIDDGRFVRVALVQIYDRQRIDMRHWAKFFKDDDFHPTKKGIQMDLNFFRDKLYPVFSRICNENKSK